MTESRRDQQEDLIREALEQPGVATAIEVFGEVSHFAPLVGVYRSDRDRYATGGNPA